MKKLFFTPLLVLFPLCSLAQDDAFDKQFFAPAAIHLFSTPPKDADVLKNPSDLLAARQTLIDFFAAVEDVNRDPTPFLEDRVRSRFKNRAEVARMLLEEETSLVIVGLSSFTRQQDNLTLSFYTVLFVEGTITAVERSANLRKIAGAWKIVAIGDLK